MKCPRCNIDMSQEPYEGVDVDRCPSCKGFWVPGYRLAQIIDIREKTFAIEEIANYSKLHKADHGLLNQANSSIKCPECGSLMTQSHYNYAAEVLIDRCPQGHGVWLDKGEIEHVQMAVEEQESEMQDIVAEKQLVVDDFASGKLEYERKKYSLSIWHLFLWPSS
ncbi:MAG TPA: zf-TFIIB domain-containing protein [Myxococcota bacterium]|nr:zf-TFIIB domain-containing protein [Myxococcota bacterium]